ncbi:MAG: A24 family peptidase [Christensenella sp.]|nr:A24 family peptidase [Christensenella sp.]
MRELLPIICGAALGATLSVPVRLICGVLLKHRGFASEMEQKYFWVLLVSLTLVGGVIGWRAGFTFRGLYLFLLLVTSACAFYIDAKHRVIPNELVLAILILAAVFGFTGAIAFNIWQSLLGLVVCFVIFFLPSLFGKQVGAGDIKLAAAMGFALGLMGGLYAVAGMGTLVLLYVMIERNMPLVQRLKTMIPMGPFLALSLVAISILLV